MAVERRDRINRNDFLKVYVPMARDGHTAREIADKLGLEDDNGANYVTVKACQIRAKVKEHAEALAVQRKLDGEEYTAFVDAMTSKVPKLTSRESSSKIEDTLDFLNTL